MTKRRYTLLSAIVTTIGIVGLVALFNSLGMYEGEENNISSVVSTSEAYSEESDIAQTSSIMAIDGGYKIDGFECISFSLSDPLVYTDERGISTIKPHSLLKNLDEWSKNNPNKRVTSMTFIPLSNTLAADLRSLGHDNVACVLLATEDR